MGTNFDPKAQEPAMQFCTHGESLSTVGNTKSSSVASLSKEEGAGASETDGGGCDGRVPVVRMVSNGRAAGRASRAAVCQIVWHAAQRLLYVPGTLVHSTRAMSRPQASHLVGGAMECTSFRLTGALCGGGKLHVNAIVFARPWSRSSKRPTGFVLPDVGDSLRMRVERNVGT